MLARGLLDENDLVSTIRRQRQWHIIAFFVTMAGMTLFATCGMDFPNPNPTHKLEDSVEWYQYTFVLSTIVAVMTTEIYLLFSYRWIYFAHVLLNVYAIGVLLWNSVAMLLVLAPCDISDPQCAFAKFTYIVRFVTSCSLLGVRIFALWNASGLRSTVENIRRARSLLVSAGKIPSSDSESTKDRMAELYTSLRNEQVFHAIVLLLAAVSWAFFAVSEMWITFRNGHDDAWVTWIWWRNFCSLACLAPIALTQLYFLLGGTISRMMSKYANWVWVLGVLPVHGVWLLYIFDNCNQYVLATVELVHPECGSPALLDDSVQPAFVWRMVTFFSMFLVMLINITVYNSTTHTLMSVSLLKKEQEELNAAPQDELASAIGAPMKIQEGVGKKHTKRAFNAWLHHEAIGSTMSEALHPSTLKAYAKELKRTQPQMAFYYPIAMASKKAR